jgi:capsular exopolysaccharide synthesis family protein
MFEKNNQSIIRLTRTELPASVTGTFEPSALASTQLSIPDLWRMVARRKVAISLFAVTLFCLVAAYTFSRTPVYQSVARLQIDPSRSSDLGLDDVEKSTNVDVDSRLKTEVDVIQSDSVATQVMNSLKLYANPEFAGDDAVEGGKQFSDLAPSERLQLLDRFKTDLLVKVVPDTQVVEIRFQSPDPAVAANVANSVVDQYMQLNFQTRVNSTMQVSKWLSGQMDEIREATTTAQQKLAEFQRQTNLIGTDENDNIVIERLKQLNEELTQAEADRIVKEERYQLARSGNPELIASAAPSSTLQVLRQQQADLQAQYSQLAAKFGNGYPKLGELASQLASTNSAIDLEDQRIQTRVANEYNAAAKDEAMIRRDFETQTAKAYKLNENVAQYSILKHQVESGQQLYDTLQLKLKEANVTSGLRSSYIRVLDRAEQPNEPVAPRKTIDLALGLGGGLFGGLILALVLDSFDDTIQSSDELQCVTALPELGSIPFVPTLTSKDREPLSLIGKTKPGSGLSSVSVMERDCPGGEAYRALCSVVLLSSASPSPKVVVVTSAVAGEGKSTVSCNLGIALAQRGEHVLIVDADLRCSSIHVQLGRVPGLSTMLATGPNPQLVYRPLDDLANLQVVPAGFRPAMPAEVLASGRMQQLLNTWSAEYDRVIIDTPPLLPFADALMLSTFADGVILVTRSGVSRNKALLRAKELLSRTRANTLGFVLNAVRRPEYYYEYPSKYKRISGAGSDGASTNSARAAGAS